MKASIQKNDICIIGSGPAGMAAGIRLSQLEIPFTIFEKEGFPRDKICGDGISGKCLMMLKRLDDGLLASLGKIENANPSWGVRFFAPNQKSFSISFKDETHGVPPGFVIRRKEFDSLLFDRLKISPWATIREKSPVNTASRSNNGYNLHDPSQKIITESRLLLISSGYDRSLIHSVCPESPSLSNDSLGLRVYYKGISGISEENAIEFYFLKELLPGYLWIFPSGEGRANVGIGMASAVITKKKISLGKLLQELIIKYPSLRIRFENASVTRKPAAQRLPLFQGKIPISGDHYLLLGDAARLVDPFTGEGIANAMLSGIIAAETAADAIKSGNYSAKYLQKYDLKIYSELEKELSLGLRLQDLGKNTALINLVIGRACRNEKIRNALKDIIFGMNSMKELKNPMFYAKLLLGID